jgi:hypothetical protein
MVVIPTVIAAARNKSLLNGGGICKYQRGKTGEGPEGPEKRNWTGIFFGNQEPEILGRNSAAVAVGINEKMPVFIYCLEKKEFLTEIYESIY